MKILTTIILILLLLCGGIYFMLFTQSGNDILKPVISKTVSSKTGQKIDIKDLTLKPDSINTLISINDYAVVKVNGALNLLKQSFDLVYNVNAKDIKTPSAVIKGKIDLDGKIKGNIKNIEIDGKGDAFNSPVNYSLKVIDNIPQNIKALITKGKTEGVLALAGQKPYLKGVFDLVVDIPRFDPNDLKGDAKFVLYDNAVNTAEVKKDFKVDLPTPTSVKGEVISHLNKKEIDTFAKLFTTLANLTVKKAVTDLSQKTPFIKSDYKVEAKLANLKSLTKMPMRGEFVLDGNILIEGKNIKIDGKSNSLGGEMRFDTNGKKLSFSILSGSIKKILYMLSQKEYSSGELNVKADFESLSPLNLKGKAVIETKNALINTALVKKEFKTDLGNKFPYSLKADADFVKEKVKAEAKLQTPIKDVTISDLVFDLKRGSLDAKYVAYFKDLSKLEPVINKKLKGDMKIEGEIKKVKDDLVVTGVSKKFDGDIKFVMKDNKVNFDAQNIRVSKILDTFLYPVVIDGKALIKADYDLVSKRGKSEAKIDKARILRSTFTDLIATFTKHDLAKERYNETTFVSTIDHEHVVFDFNAKSKNSYISFKKGKINTKTNTIDAPFDILLKKKDFKGVIKGNINKPKVKLDTSKYLKEKAVNKVEKLIDKKLGGDKAKKLKGILNLFK